jgi:hypothetical protein
MHVQIDADTRRGLRIIEEIPDIHLCKIEGYNGIGKTSAIRLLQLCTGEQPFKGNRAAWRTFRAQLGPSYVRVSALLEARDIEWWLEPSEWPEEPVPLTDDKIGTLHINGRKKDIDDVRQLLRVYHFNTTETPAKILTARATVAGSTVATWYSDYGSQRTAEIDTAFRDALKVLDACPTVQVRLAQEVARTAHEAALALAARLVAARNQVQLLSKAVAIADQLDTVRGTGPQLRNKLQELDRALERTDEEIAGLNDQIAKTELQKHLDEQAEDRFARAEKLVARHKNSLLRAREALRHAASAAGINPSHQNVEAASLKVAQQLHELVEAQPFVSAGPQMLAVLNDISRLLEDAIRVGLGDKVLIDTDGAPKAWTVAELHEAFQSQMGRISERMHGADGELLVAEIASLRRRLDALADVNEKLESVGKFENWLRQAEQALVEATPDVDDGSANRLTELLRRRNEHEKAGRELQSRIDRMRAELDLLGGGKTEEALARQLQEVTSEAKVDPTRIRGALERAQSNLMTIGQDDAEAQMKDASAVHGLEAMLASVQDTITKLSEDRTFAWLRAAAPEINHLRDLQIDEQLTVLENLNVRLITARRSLDDTMSQVRSIGAALYEVARALADSNGDERKRQAWTVPAGRWLGEQARQWFEDEIVRDALFNGGHSLRLDPAELTVSWESDGQFYERPLAAFSSGQQAFAFTRARVAQLDRDMDDVANRLIALDEFGAFMDARLFGGLVDYLAQRAPETPRDQVLVILPCAIASPDFTSTSGKLSERDAQLMRRGYFAEPLQA